MCTWYQKDAARHFFGHYKMLSGSCVVQSLVCSFLISVIFTWAIDVTGDNRICLEALWCWDDAWPYNGVELCEMSYAFAFPYHVSILFPISCISIFSHIIYQYYFPYHLLVLFLVSCIIIFPHIMYQYFSPYHVLVLFLVSCISIILNWITMCEKHHQHAIHPTNGAVTPE